MKKRWSVVLLLLLLTLMLVGCASGEAEKEQDTLRIMAAISLQRALQEIEEIYEKGHDIDVQFQFGGSGTLARQIEQGIEGDIFLSANAEWMNMLEEGGRVVKGTRVPVIHNSLVLVTNNSTVDVYDDLSQVDFSEIDQVAIGNPETVPAGSYAKTALDTMGIWRDLEQRIVIAKDVRQVATYVESGNVDYGFVYSSDVLLSESLSVVAPVREKDHDPIVYPGAVIHDSENTKAARDFLEFLQTEEAQGIFDAYGFGGE